MTWLVADQLGTTTLVLDAAGATVADQRYWPYGAVRAGGVTQTDRLYTGQRQEAADQALGLYDYRARYYSTLMGRFVSADPTAPRGSSMPLNRFAYANDNPLRFLDPSGYNPTQQDLENCAANIIACYEWSYGGDSPKAIVFVMGWGEGIRGGAFGDLSDYEGYATTFLDRYDPGCAGRSGDCWAAARSLLMKYGSDTAYRVFGLKFIESDPHGHLWKGVLGRIPFVGQYISDNGIGELGRFIKSQAYKIVGVVGVSLGAGTVAKYFAEHRHTRIPFFLDSPVPVIDPWYGYAIRARSTSGFVGMTAARSCGRCGNWPLNHGARDDLAVQVFDAFDQYVLTGDGCCVGD